MEGTIAAPHRAADTLGRYRIEDQIGAGAFATTYRATDSILGRPVALKVLRPELAADATYLARFAREARAAAAVDHPNVVHVFDFGEEEGTYYLALQYVHGATLKDVIRERAPLPPAEAVRIGGQILRGLAAIHGTGIVHRDVKPQNVLVDHLGVARITDFGIVHDTAESGAGLTTHGTALGTPSYMAPEQASARPVTQGTDLYATGVVLFELLTGRLPFSAENALALMLAHVQISPPAPSALVPTVPPALDAVVLTALAKEPADRFPSALAMEQALLAALPQTGAPNAPTKPFAGRGLRASAVPPAGTATGPTIPLSNRPVPATARPAAGPPPAKPAVRRRPAWFVPVVVAIVALFALGVALAGAFRGDGDDGPPTATAGGQVAAANPTDTPTPAAAPTEAARQIVLVAPTETQPPDTPSPTEPPAPTDTPRPTRTATAEPTATTAPSPTATPSPQPTATAPARPTESQTLQESDSEGGGQSGNEPSAGDTAPTIAPSDGGRAASADQEAATEAEPEQARDADAEPSESNLSENDTPLALSFSATDWQGGYQRGDSAFLGRPWTALYGAQSGYDRATLSFALDVAPSGDTELTIVGIDDEWGGDHPISVTVNGVEVFAGPSPFPAWDGAGNGENAQWGELRLSIPAGALVAGANEIVVANLVDSANVGLPPYVLLSDATLSTG